MNPQRLIHLLNDMRMGLSAVASAMVSILMYALLASEALFSKGWAPVEGRCAAGLGARYPREKSLWPRVHCDVVS